MPIKIMPITIPRIINRLEGLPEELDDDDDVSVGEWYKGVFTGDAANVGAETEKDMLLYIGGMFIVFCSITVEKSIWH